MATLVSALGLAAVHLLANQLRFLHGIPRSKWLSFAGGAAVAYVFLHLMPELSQRQDMFAENEPKALSFMRHHLFVLALLGLSVFYGIERWIKSEKGDKVRADERPLEQNPREEKLTFWLHIVSFFVYNLLIGYLLGQRSTSTSSTSTFLFALAMAFHFIVNDYGLLEHHRSLYLRFGRWLVSLAIVAGWVLSNFVALPQEIVSGVFAFIGGGVILNVMKEELPEERKSNFWAFFTGATAYTILILIQQ